MLLLACIALTALALVDQPTSPADVRPPVPAAQALSADALARCGAGRARLERYASEATALARRLEGHRRASAVRRLTSVVGRWYATIRGSRPCLGARGVEIESRVVDALLVRVTR